MKNIKKEKDEWGHWVIYVYECDKFKYEHPDTIKNLCQHDFEIWQQYSIME